MKTNQMFRHARLIAISLAVLLCSSLVISQSKVSDFDNPLPILPQKDHLNVDEAEQLLSGNPDLVVLDVRKKREYNKSHLANAINADYFSKDFQSKLDALDKTKPYVVYCKSGVRSDEAVRRMNELGIEQVSIIGGGFRAWRAAGKEIVDGQK